MKIICRPRQSWKTFDMIKLCEIMWYRILCVDEQRKKHIWELAHKMNIKIKPPITSKELDKLRWYRDRKIIIDDADMLLQNMIDADIKAISVTDD